MTPFVLIAHVNDSDIKDFREGLDNEFLDNQGFLDAGNATQECLCDTDKFVLAGAFDDDICPSDAYRRLTERYPAASWTLVQKNATHIKIYGDTSVLRHCIYTVSAGLFGDGDNPEILYASTVSNHARIVMQAKALEAHAAAPEEYDLADGESGILAESQTATRGGAGYIRLSRITLL